ncbi:response regulator [bacterium]
MKNGTQVDSIIDTMDKLGLNSIMNSPIDNFLFHDAFLYNSTKRNPSENPPYRILIVEDEMIVAMDLALYLEQDGYNIVGLVKDGLDAVTMAVHTRPDIIIMDIDLPGDIDGISAAKMIHQRIQTQIIFASGHSDSDPRIQQIIDKGIHPFVRKPYYGDTLKNIISEL